MPAPEMLQVLVRAGNLYLSAALCQRYLPQLGGVALLRREPYVLLLPLLPEAGGLLLKQRNAAGDRVLHAQEFFREHGYAERDEPQSLPVHWDSTQAALCMPEPARRAA